MNITFIRPNMNTRQSADAMEPIVFGLLAALTPPHMDITLLDERIEPLVLDDSPDLVALTVETFTARRAYQIAAHYRNLGIPVVMGGFHPSLLPTEAAQFADALVIGDAEELWPRLLNDFQSGRLQPVYQQSIPPPLTNCQWDYAIFRNKKYGKIKPVQTGRGCKYGCDFCSINALYGNSIRQRPINEVAREIEALKAKYIFLVDDNLFSNRSRTKALLKELIPLNIRWVCQSSMEISRDATLMDLLARSGCVAAIIGFESLNRENLKLMKKKSNLQDHDYPTAIARFHDRGIMIYATFVFGYDHDTVDSFRPVVDFSLRSRFFLANFNPLTPTPGTPLYARLLRENRLLHDRWWLDPTYRYGEATFRPKGMTPAQLTNGCFQARKSFNSCSSIFSRALNRKANSRSMANLSLYLQANLITRKEIFAKQGTHLGAPRPLISLDNPPCE